MYISTIWNQLPNTVPTHFDFHGDANDWSNKTILIFIPSALGIFINLIMLVIPVIDPKKKIEQMCDKFFSLRFILTIFFTLMAIYLLYITKVGRLQNPSILFSLIELLFAFLGNYFQTLRPNYFIGIRTPWTMENEEVWKKTHRFGGLIWILGGALIVILAFLIKNSFSLTIVFAIIVSLLAILPVVYSNIQFHKEKQ